MRIHSGRLKGSPLPVAQGARPVGGRLKVSLFSVLAGHLPDARVLDLCAGVGGLGLEALSRGAGSVVLVDRDPQACAALEAWIARVDPGGGASVLQADALAGPLPPGPFDLVFLDPPFVDWEGPTALAMLRRSVATLATEGLLVCKLPAKTHVPEDPAWRIVRRTAVASAAYALLALPGPTEGGRESVGDDQADAADGRM